jgi:hypothetical protein
MTALSGAVGPTQPLSGAASRPVPPPAVPLLAPPQRVQIRCSSRRARGRAPIERRRAAGFAILSAGALL